MADALNFTWISGAEGWVALATLTALERAVEWAESESFGLILLSGDLLSRDRKSRFPRANNRRLELQS